jgi:hypothetical protein
VKTFDDFFFSILPSEQKIITRLRNIILDTSPKLVEKMSYGAPFYFIRQRICFLWPASLAMSGIKEGVNLGLCKGYLLSDEQKALDKGNRKEVYYLHFKSLSEINEELLKEMLFEAILVDEEHGNKSKRKK